MKLSSYLDSKLIFVNVEAKTKDEAINTMIDKIAKVDRGFAKQKDTIKDTVLAREHEIPTAVGKEIAIPHARVEGYHDVVVALGVLKEKIACELATQERGWVKILFMIVVEKTKNQLMLQLMAAIMKLAIQQDLLDAISHASAPDNIFALIKKAKIEVKETLSAEDIMNTEIVPAKLDHTLEEIATRLVVENLVGLPVVDDAGQFLGEITERELIQYGMPKYTSVMTDLSFMTIGEPFEEYFKHESHVTVKELYRHNPMTIDKQASIMEISFIMVTQGNTRMYVVENERYVGMVVRSDIIRKVLHI
jgi:PTS system nitrogen regulatory IIA component